MSRRRKTYANQLKGAAILETIWARQPEHPGVAHYLIHLYDTPALADKGLAAARRYAKVAPDAAHAQHMPSHIFTRVGYWQDSIASNTESSRVAAQSADFHDQLHSMDYLVYAHLQLGQDSKAKEVLEKMTTVKGSSKLSLQDRMRWLLRPRVMPWSAVIGRQRQNFRSALVRSPTCRPLPISHARSVLPVRTIRKRPRPTSSSSPSCATSCATPRMRIGPNRSISNGRSRPPGCCTPTVSAMRHSRR